MTNPIFSEPHRPLPDLSGHNCMVCGRFGSFGFGPPRGTVRWYCHTHRGEGQAWWSGIRGDLASAGITAPGDAKKPLSLDDLVVEVNGKPVERRTEGPPEKKQGSLF